MFQILAKNLCPLPVATPCVEGIEVEIVFLRHRHDDLDVEGDGRGGHDHNERLAGQQGEQDAPDGLAEDGAHHAQLAAWTHSNHHRFVGPNLCFDS